MRCAVHPQHGFNPYNNIIVVRVVANVEATVEDYLTISATTDTGDDVEGGASGPI